MTSSGSTPPRSRNGIARRAAIAAGAALSGSSPELAANGSDSAPRPPLGDPRSTGHAPGRGAPAVEADPSAAEPDRDRAGATHLGTPDGQLAARCFALFKAGRSPRDVVIELAVPPGSVLEQYGHWLVLGGTLPLPLPARGLLARAAGVALTENNLTEVISEVVADALELRRFTYQCGACGRPVRAQADQEWTAVVSAGALRTRVHAECDGRGRDDGAQ